MIFISSWSQRESIAFQGQPSNHTTYVHIYIHHFTLTKYKKIKAGLKFVYI